MIDKLLENTTGHFVETLHLAIVSLIRMKDVT